ncbi:MAG TPA: hypothetical protein VHP11_14255 [Tepidisphaeraceae bacterium]|nr:hypothetical protein [Tepidisphaeraceae bacterium]
MFEYHPSPPGHERVPGTTPEMPLGFRVLPETLHPWVDRKLGYFGSARFVMFYYEPRGEEVIWRDNHSYGFAAGAWCFFTDKIAPLAETYHVNLGSSDCQGREALIIDRLKRQAYFAERKTAEQFIARQQAFNPPPETQHC